MAYFIPYYKYKKQENSGLYLFGKSVFSEKNKYRKREECFINILYKRFFIRSLHHTG